MKVYLNKVEYNICGRKTWDYEICTHDKKHKNRAKYLTIEKRNDTWMCWFCFNEGKPNVMCKSLDGILDVARNTVSNFTLIKTGKFVNPDDIEIVGLNEIVEK